MIDEATAARFWAQVDTSGTCWIWKGVCNQQGYGTFYYDGHVQPAHRVAFILTYGWYLPGLVLMHTCDNPPCVRPVHLLPGTHDDNMLDMVRKGRAGWQTGKLWIPSPRQRTEPPLYSTLKEAMARATVIRTTRGEPRLTFQCLAEETGIREKTLHYIATDRCGHVNLKNYSTLLRFFKQYFPATLDDLLSRTSPKKKAA